jgi:hypothetical protein
MCGYVHWQNIAATVSAPCLADAWHASCVAVFDNSEYIQHCIRVQQRINFWSKRKYTRNTLITAKMHALLNIFAGYTLTQQYDCKQAINWPAVHYKALC